MSTKLPGRQLGIYRIKLRGHKDWSEAEYGIIQTIKDEGYTYDFYGFKQEGKAIDQFDIEDSEWEPIIRKENE